MNLTNVDYDDLVNIYKDSNIYKGGKWRPKYCKQQKSNYVAIIIPYRNRKKHLNLFLLNMLPLFMRQKLTFGIYLIEPIESIKFNRGILLNIGFLESNKDFNNLWTCHSFHDIDLLSENDYTLYKCPQTPTHLSHRINKFNYRFVNLKSVANNIYSVLFKYYAKHKLWWCNYYWQKPIYWCQWIFKFIFWLGWRR